MNCTLEDDAAAICRNDQVDADIENLIKIFHKAFRYSTLGDSFGDATGWHLCQSGTKSASASKVTADVSDHFTRFVGVFGD